MLVNLPLKPELRWGMTVTPGDVLVGIAAIAGGIGLLLSYRRDVRRKADLVAEFKRRELSESSSQHPSGDNPK
jgi:hypothetical protein